MGFPEGQQAPLARCAPGARESEKGELEARPDPERSLLFLVARTSQTAAAQEEIGHLLASAIDWERFLALCARHGALALAYRSLWSRFASQVPETVFARLRGGALAAIAQHHTLTAELAQILEALSAENIRALPLKGPVVAAALYDQPWLRTAGDLDVLVPKRQARQAREVLIRRGFREPPRPGAHLPWNEKHFVLFNPAATVVLELHWDLHEPAFGFRLDPEQVFASAVPVYLQGRAVPCGAPEHLLLMLAAHGARHGWDNLKWICDIAQLATRQPAPVLQRALQLSKRCRCEWMVQLALRLADDIGGASCAQVLASPAVARSMDRVVKDVREQLGSLPAAAVSAPDALVGVTARDFAFLLRCRGGAGPRLRLLLYQFASRAYPNEQDLRRLKLPAPMRLAYWLIRPVRILQAYGLQAILLYAGNVLAGLLGMSNGPGRGSREARLSEQVTGRERLSPKGEEVVEQLQPLEF